MPGGRGQGAGRCAHLTLKAEIARLDRDVGSNRTIVARQIVDFDKMTKEVEELTAKLNQREESNAGLQGSGRRATSVSFNKQTLTAKEATDKLDEGVDAATRTRSLLRSKERLVAVNGEVLDTNRAKLNALASEKSKLMEQVLVLEAEYRELQARQTESTIQVDDSRTAEIKHSLEKLKDRVKVEQTKQTLADEASRRQRRQGQDPGVRAPASTMTTSRATRSRSRRRSNFPPWGELARDRLAVATRE